MQRFPLRRGAAVLALAFLAACQDNPAAGPREAGIDPEIVRQVEALGFRGDMIRDLGDAVVVEGDIYLPKSRLRGVPARGEGEMSPTFQYSTTNLVGSPKVHQVTVNLQGLASQTGWLAAAQEALGHWSGIANSYVRLTETTGAADITVTTNCDAYYVAASASFPAGGNPGTVIYVNTCFGYGTTHAQKVHNMVHEFGHTLGFRHSNWSSQGESASPNGANLVSGTPTSDAGSVMNGGTALNSWAGFSAADQTATRTLYPLPIPTVTVTSSGGTPLVGWSALTGASGYTVKELNTVSVRSKVEPSWSDTYTRTVGTTTGTSILDTGATYTGVSSCFDEFPDNTTRTERWQYEVTAQFPTGTTKRLVAAPVGYC